MRVVKCVNGHFYDEDKYQQCPHCGGVNVGNAIINGQANSNDKRETDNGGEKKKKHKLFGGKKKQEPAQFAIPPAPNMSEAQYQQAQVLQSQVPQENDDERTVLIEPVTPPPSVMERPPVYSMQSVQMQPNISIQQSEPITPSIQPNVPMSQVMQPQHNQGDGMQTVAFYDTVTEPVTGWLVCIKGECFGESFEIKAGRNNIGRGTNMDVALLREMSVSRDKHAVIVFDPMNLKFLIQSGENGLTYVNEELLMGVKELKANDKIMLGTAIFMFVPFCGENFDWRNYQN